MQQKIAVYPGTFDPVTLGHMDVIKRALNVVDKLVVGVAESPHKNTLFSIDERAKMLEESIKDIKDSHRVHIVAFNELLVNFVHKQQASIIVRGLRAVSDFDYEFQMAGMNRHIAPDVETVFLMAADKYQLIASRFVREVARLDGNVSPFVSPLVEAALKKKFSK